jgi:hypothetical protein
MMTAKILKNIFFGARWRGVCPQLPPLVSWLQL